MTFEKVREVFKDDLAADGMYEIVMPSHGYTVLEWDAQPALGKEYWLIPLHFRAILPVYTAQQFKLDGEKSMDTIYDNKAFYDAYAQMARSKDGLSSAGEWHQLQPLFPPLSGKSVLDLGCGYGWHSKYAAEQGALSVVGLDLSARMIGEARRRNPAANITYKVCGVEEYEYPENTYDLVISNLVLHYITDLEPIFRRIFQTLKAGGIFLFNIEHPVFTAGINEDWLYGEDGNPTAWPVDNYFYPGERQTVFLGHSVTKQHHTLTQILMGVINAGFTLDHIEEAQPPKEMMNVAGMKDEMRRPMMLLVRARK